MSETVRQYRSQSVYVTSQLHRWLSWLAVAQEKETPDLVAEKLLRAAILMQCPQIEQYEAKYQAGRKRLNDEAKAMLAKPEPSTADDGELTP
jgi:hypothetical protein